MNRYKDFARLFNLELGEPFRIKPINSETPYEKLYKFTEDGLKGYENDGWLYDDDSRFHKLLNGDYEIVYSQFKPKLGEFYWFWSGMGVNKREWINHTYDLLLWKVGNCFSTFEECAEKGERIMNQIRKEYLENE